MAEDKKKNTWKEKLAKAMKICGAVLSSTPGRVGVVLAAIAVSANIVNAAVDVLNTNQEEANKLVSVLAAKEEIVEMITDEIKGNFEKAASGEISLSEATDRNQDLVTPNGIMEIAKEDKEGRELVEEFEKSEADVAEDLTLLRAGFLVTLLAGGVAAKSLIEDRKKLKDWTNQAEDTIYKGKQKKFKAVAKEYSKEKDKHNIMGCALDVIEDLGNGASQEEVIEYIKQYEFEDNEYKEVLELVATFACDGGTNLYISQVGLENLSIDEKEWLLKMDRINQRCSEQESESTM